MDPGIATVVTALCIAVLLRLDRDERPADRLVLWLPIAWIVVIGSRFVSQWMSLGTPTAAAAADDSSPIDAAYFAVLLVLAAGVLARRGPPLGALLRANLLLFAFLAYGLVAVSWSDEPTIALKRWVKVLGHPMMALIVLGHAEPLRALHYVMRRCACLLLLPSVLMIKYYPAYGRSFDAYSGLPTSIGVGLSKNDLGYLCMLFGLYVVWRLLRAGPPERRARAVDALLLAVAAWLLLQANSATSLVALLLGSGAMAALRLGLLDARRLGRWILACGLLLLASQAHFDLLDELLESLGRDATLTDRTLLWADVLQLQTNPLFGHGFESFWLGLRVELLWQKWWWRPNQAHNGYLETYLNLGAVGLGLLLLLLHSTYRRIVRDLREGSPLAPLRLALFLAIVVFNWTEASFKAVHLVWTFFYLIALELPRADRTVPAAASGAPPASREGGRVIGAMTGGMTGAMTGRDGAVPAARRSAPGEAST